MRRLVMVRPFTGGIVTDAPDHALGPEHSPFLQDGFSPQGVYKQRQGWSYDGTTADAAENLAGVHRAQYIVADATRTITADGDGEVYVHNASSAGTLIETGSVSLLPRCVYRDELILCGQDGQTPARRYSGSAVTNLGATASQWNAGKATATATSGNWSGAGSGMYYFSEGIDGLPSLHFRVLEVPSSTVLTMEDVRASILASTGTTAITTVGLFWPCVSVYNAGTISFSTGTGTATGTGTKWSSGAWGSVTNKDAVLLLTAAGGAEIDGVVTVASDTSLTSLNFSTNYTDVNYQILRKAPFKDAAAHKGSLWGTGVAQYPSRVYVGPPGWNPSLPPGREPPFDPAVAWTTTNPNDALLDFIDVPSSYDGDDNVAILSSPNPLLVLKRQAVYGIYGPFPNFSVDMVADGIGCIDIRSAHSYDEGQFWAGEGGIYWYSGGQIRDLTAGRINREWRALARDFDYGTLDYCTLGVSQGHLVVHITTGGGVTQRTYLCDLRDGTWQSRISNFTPRYMYTSRLPGEKEKLLAVSDARQGRVIDFAPALDGSGTASDDAGSAPRLQFRTGTGIARADGIEGITKLVDLEVHANVYDAGAAGSTVLSLSTVHGGGTSNQADATKTLTAINSDTADRIDRHSRRIGRNGRFHQLRGEVSTLGTDSNATKIEVHQVTASVRDWRSRS